MRLKIEEAIELYNSKRGKEDQLEIRAVANITFKDVELSLGSKHRYLSDMNTGKRRKAKPDEIVMIAKVLEVSTDFLLGYESEETKTLKELLKQCKTSLRFAINGKPRKIDTDLVKMIDIILNN